MKARLDYLCRLSAVALAVFWPVIQSLSQEATPVKVRALKDNTNLRARSAPDVEVVGQVFAGQELIARSIDADWVEVVAPTNIDFWVLGDYLKDGVIVCKTKVNVRAGPGINFSIVGQLSNQAEVEIRGSHDDWIKIAPPENCSLWVARSLVELVSVRPPPPPPPSKPPVDLTSATPAKPDTKKIESTEPLKPVSATNLPPVGKRLESPRSGLAVTPPKDLDLIPDIAQGQWKQYEGVLRPKGFLVRSPSDFRLVGYDAKEGRSRTLCFVKGNRTQLDALLFREMEIHGRQYWVQRQRYPVLVPEKIILK